MFYSTVNVENMCQYLTLEQTFHAFCLGVKMMGFSTKLLLNFGIIIVDSSLITYL
jgi:hypothetical protein